MKRMTTEYFCDLCGNLVTRGEVTQTLFPRRIAIYTKTGGIVKYSSVKMMPTDICTACQKKVASFFPEIDKELDEGYQE